MTILPDADQTHTSRTRLLQAGKTLFARLGFEQTSTASIAREAGSSESQLIRYFGGKAGLLEAIFNESWKPLTAQIQPLVDESSHGRDAIVRVLRLMIEAFALDHDIASLFVFEGRRIRGASHEVTLSQGFLQFYALIRSLIKRGQSDGSFPADVPDEVLASAMLGLAEGMLRDRIIAARSGLPNIFDDATISRVFVAMVNGLASA